MIHYLNVEFKMNDCLCNLQIYFWIWIVVLLFFLFFIFINGACRLTLLHNNPTTLKFKRYPFGDKEEDISLFSCLPF